MRTSSSLQEQVPVRWALQPEEWSFSRNLWSAIIYISKTGQWKKRENTGCRIKSLNYLGQIGGKLKKNHSKSNDFKWFIWQREKDSNPHLRSQSPLCYLYTIPLNAKCIIQSFCDLSRVWRRFLRFFLISLPYIIIADLRFLEKRYSSVCNATRNLLLQTWWFSHTGCWFVRLSEYNRYWNV